MNSYEISKIFNITHPYDKQSLKNAFLIKISSIKLNEHISHNDQQILIDSYTNKYNIGKLYIENNKIISPYNNFNNNFNNYLNNIVKKFEDNQFINDTNSNINSNYQSYYCTTSNINGNKTILESKTKSINGKTDTYKQAYTIDKYGNRKNINYDKLINKKI